MKIIKISESKLIEIIRSKFDSNYVEGSYKVRRDEFFNKFNNIKSFKEVDDTLIKDIIEFIGFEGFNSEDDAIEHISWMINNIYKKLKDPTKLYRVVGVKNKKQINSKDLGYHYVLDKIDIDLDSIGFDMFDEELTPYIMEVLVSLSEINIQQTIRQNLNFPNENDITLKNNGRGAKFIKATKY